MSGSSFGKLFRITSWGESHGLAVGVVIDGCPAGLPLEAEDIQRYLDRRRPGQSKYTTRRNESDTAEILSGVFEGERQPARLSVSPSTTKTSVPEITERSHIHSVRDTRIIHLRKNTVSGITAAADVPPDARR